MGHKTGSTKNHQPLILSSIIAHFLFPQETELSDEEGWLNSFASFFDLKTTQKKSKENLEKLRKDIKEALIKRDPDLASFKSNEAFFEKFPNDISLPLHDPWHY